MAVWSSTIKHNKAEKKLLFPEMRMTRTIFIRAAMNLFFKSIFRKYSFFFFSFFCFFCILAFCFFFLLVCFLKLKIYILIHIQLCERVVIKFFHSASFRKQDYFFCLNLNKCNCIKSFTNNWLKAEWIINQKILDIKVCCCPWSTEKLQTLFLEVALVHFNKKCRSWS